MKTIEIKRLITSKVLFSHTQNDNTILKTLELANFKGAKLSGADLRDANLDFCGWPLSCFSLGVKTSTRLRIQLCFHFLSLIKCSGNATEEEKQILGYLEPYANKFHRSDVPKL